MGRNSKIFCCFLVLSILVFTYVGLQSRKQVDIRKNDYEKYISVREQINTNTDLEKALDQIEYLEDKYPETDLILVDKASIYLGMKDYKNAETCLSRAFEIKPSLSGNIKLLVLYAETLDKVDDKEKFREVMDKIEKIEVPEELKQRVDKLNNKLN